MGKQISITFIVDTNIYSMEAVYAASYAFIDKAYVYLSGDPRSVVKIRLKPKVKGDFYFTRGEFMNELLNAALRVRISERNKQVREYIVGTALLGATGEVPSIARPSNQADRSDEYVNFSGVVDNAWEDDPLGIAVPWEEKYQQGAPVASCHGPSCDPNIEKRGGLSTSENKAEEIDEDISKYASLWTPEDGDKKETEK